MSNLKGLLVIAFLSVLLGVSEGISFSNALGSNMVLQRSPSQARVWGPCDDVPECEVKVIFLEQTYIPTVDTTANYWSVYLPPMPAGGPYNITAIDTNNDSVTLEEVLFGDVFVCSGQSNMEFTVSQSLNATEEIAKAANYRNIRLFTVGQGTTSNTALYEFNTVEQPWVVASPTTVGGPQYSVFSGACWFFATNLYFQIQVPIGLVSSNWGGTSVQQWSSSDVLSSCNSPPSSSDSQLWNAMIYPLLPMSIKGALWYQGESNVGQPELYSCLFPGMITDWRNKWQNSNNLNFGFYYVMLAAYTVYPGDVTLPELRESQLAALSLPNVGFGSAVDLGDLNSPYGDIHPQDKETVGYRLQLQALKLTYNRNIQADGPLFESATNNPTVPIDNDLYETSCTIAFTSETVGNNLIVVDNVCPEGISGYCAWFDVELDDGLGWRAATSANIGSDAVSVVVAYQTNYAGVITGVRYGWADWPVCTLYNNANLPVTPFYYQFPSANQSN